MILYNIEKDMNELRDDPGKISSSCQCRGHRGMDQYPGNPAIQQSAMSNAHLT